MSPPSTPQPVPDHNTWPTVYGDQVCEVCGRAWFTGVPPHCEICGLTLDQALPQFVPTMLVIDQQMINAHGICAEAEARRVWAIYVRAGMPNGRTHEGMSQWARDHGGVGFVLADDLQYRAEKAEAAGVEVRFS